MCDEYNLDYIEFSLFQFVQRQSNAFSQSHKMYQQLHQPKWKKVKNHIEWMWMNRNASNYTSTNEQFKQTIQSTNKINSKKKKPTTKLLNMRQWLNPTSHGLCFGLSIEINMNKKK